MKAEKVVRLIETANILSQSGKIFTKWKLAQMTGINPSLVYLAAYQKIIKLKSKGEQIISRIKEEMKQNTPIYRIREKLDVNPPTLYQKARSINISLKEGPILNNDEIRELLSNLHEDEKSLKIAVLALQGLPSTKIGEIIGITREGANIYISGLGLYTTWREKRREKFEEEIAQREELRSSRSKLLSLIRAEYEKKINLLSDIERKALDYCTANYARMARDATPYKKIVRLLYNYDNARKFGYEPTLEDLSKKSGIAMTSMSPIMRTLGLKPFHDARKHLRVSDEKKEALISALRIPYLTRRDVRKWSGLSLCNINQNVPIQSEENYRTKHIRIFPHKKRSPFITYKKASEIYEALDLGFTIKETAYLEDVSTPAVLHCREYRRRIAPRIIHALKTIFPHADIRKPYYKSSFDEMYK